MTKCVRVYMYKYKQLRPSKCIEWNWFNMVQLCCKGPTNEATVHGSNFEKPHDQMTTHALAPGQGFDMVRLLTGLGFWQDFFQLTIFVHLHHLSPSFQFQPLQKHP